MSRITDSLEQSRTHRRIQHPVGFQPSESSGSRSAEAENEIDFLKSRFRGFSCPQEGLDEAILLVAVTPARETTRLFLRRYVAELTCRRHNVCRRAHQGVGQLEKPERQPAVTEILGGARRQPHPNHACDS